MSPKAMVALLLAVMALLVVSGAASHAAGWYMLRNYLGAMAAGMGGPIGLAIQGWVASRKAAEERL